MGSFFLFETALGLFLRGGLKPSRPKRRDKLFSLDFRMFLNINKKRS
jgi:hypothetical protein